MAANGALKRTNLIDEAVVRLGEMLPRGWQVERQIENDGEADAGTDGSILLRDARHVGVTIAVQAKRVFGPREVAALSGGLLRVVRSLAGYVPVLVVAPWISPRTQGLLAEQDINYLDLTGNARVKLDSPSLYIRTVGLARNPQPAPRGAATLRGPRAARLMRLLIDVRPPYGVGEIAAATGLAQGYVSRLLDALDREALIERAQRGRVSDVDVAGVLRRWAESYDVLRTNAAATFLAPRGAADALSRIAGLADRESVAISGSFAAVRLAPVAAPALLLAYCRQIEKVADALGLLPAEEGTNVALLVSFDPVVWERTIEDGGTLYVAPSQAAADCLTGTGRMPAEGEALIEWMAANEPDWRLSSLEDLARSRASA